MTLPFEPYRIRTVEPIFETTRAERRRLLELAGFNLFRIPASKVLIDLVTDSGTGAMSTRQWAAMMRGDEAYAGSSSYFRLVDAVREITGIGNVLPTHQGRAAERLLVEAIIGKPFDGNGQTVPNNAHFDTTRHMIESSGAEAVDLLNAGGDDPAHDAPFKGDMDLHRLQDLLAKRGEQVPFVMLTLTCNSNGGQPVSLANLRAVRRICDRFRTPLILDACRFAENAWFIKHREAGLRDRTISSIVRDAFDACDGAAMSTRKDGLCNSGGLLLLRDDALFERARSLCVLTQGFQMSYGSLPGRDLEAIAVGLHEAMDEGYLNSRVMLVHALGEQLEDGSVPIVKPVGGHAVYVDAEAFCPHLGPADHPAHALACSMYEQTGIRCTRIGSALRSRGGRPMELVRLAIPRRTYSAAHLRFVAENIAALHARAHEIHPVPYSASPAAGRDEPVFEAA